MGDFFGEMIGQFFFEVIKGVFRTPGAFVLWLLGGCKRNFSYYTELDNYGYIPHFIGVVLLSAIIFLIFYFK